MYNQFVQFDAGDQNLNKTPKSSGQQAQASFVDASAGSQQSSMISSGQQPQSPFMNAFFTSQQSNMMQSEQQPQSPFMERFANNQQSNMVQSGQQPQTPFMDGFASNQQPSMMPPMGQQAQTSFMDRSVSNQQPNMMLPMGQQSQTPFMDTFPNNRQANMMSLGQQAQTPFMDQFASSQQLNMMRELQNFYQFGNAFNGNPYIQMNREQFMNGLASTQQLNNMSVNQTQQQNMSELKHGQKNAPFMNAMDVFNLSNQKNYENAAHPKKARLDQGFADSSQYSPYVQSNTSNIPASMQAHQNFATSSNFHSNVQVSPSFPTNHSTSLQHQSSNFNNPIEQVKNPKIEQLKRSIHELDKLNIPELAQTRKIVSDELERLEHNVNDDWLDFKSHAVITIVKYVWLSSRPDINIVDRLLGPNGSGLKNICKNYNCKIDILGAGSTGKSEIENQLLRSEDPKHQHFALPLHLKISVKGAPPQVYERFWKVLDLIFCIIDMKNVSFDFGRNRTNNYKTFSQQQKQLKKKHNRAQKRRESKIMANANEIPLNDQGAKMLAGTQKTSELPAKKTRPDIVTID